MVSRCRFIRLRSPKEAEGEPWSPSEPLNEIDTEALFGAGDDGQDFPGGGGGGRSSGGSSGESGGEGSSSFGGGGDRGAATPPKGRQGFKVTAPTHLMRAARAQN